MAGPNSPKPGAGGYDLFAVELGLNAQDGYILSGKDRTSPWASNHLIRDDHPVAWNGEAGGPEPFGTVLFSGWSNDYVPTYVFDFAGLDGGGLNVGQEFIIGWTQNCANDVLYEQIRNPAPPPVSVSEPATMLLLGFGLIGLAGIGRKMVRG